jgi:hypothetical protein
MFPLQAAVYVHEKRNPWLQRRNPWTFMGGPTMHLSNERNVFHLDGKDPKKPPLKKCREMRGTEGPLATIV